MKKLISCISSVALATSMTSTLTSCGSPKITSDEIKNFLENPSTAYFTAGDIKITSMSNLTSEDLKQANLYPKSFTSVSSSVSFLNVLISISKNTTLESDYSTDNNNYNKEYIMDSYTFKVNNFKNSGISNFMYKNPYNQKIEYTCKSRNNDSNQLVEDYSLSGTYDTTFDWGEVYFIGSALDKLILKEIATNVEYCGIKKVHENSENNTYYVFKHNSDFINIYDYTN